MRLARAEEDTISHSDIEMPVCGMATMQDKEELNFDETEFGDFIVQIRLVTGSAVRVKVGRLQAERLQASRTGNVRKACAVPATVF